MSGKLRNRAEVEFLNTGNIEIFGISHTKEGNIVDKYQPVVCGVGFIGKGTFNSKSKVHTVKIYNTWSGMLNRVYNQNDNRYVSYGGRGVTVCKEWFNFQNFAEWYYKQRSPLPPDVEYQLDKDLKGGEIYSPDTCILIPKSLNVALQTSRPSGNSKLSTGIRFIKDCNKYVAQVSCANKSIVGESMKLSGTHRSTLSEAKQDYIKLKYYELGVVSEYLLSKNLITEEIRDLVRNYNIEKTLDIYK